MIYRVCATLLAAIVVSGCSTHSYNTRDCDNHSVFCIEEISDNGNWSLPVLDMDEDEVLAQNSLSHLCYLYHSLSEKQVYKNNMEIQELHRYKARLLDLIQKRSSSSQVSYYARQLNIPSDRGQYTAIGTNGTLTEINGVKLPFSLPADGFNDRDISLIRRGRYDVGMSELALMCIIYPGGITEYSSLHVSQYSVSRFFTNNGVHFSIRNGVLTSYSTNSYR